MTATIIAVGCWRGDNIKELQRLFGRGVKLEKVGTALRITVYRKAGDFITHREKGQYITQVVHG